MLRGADASILRENKRSSLDLTEQLRMDLGAHNLTFEVVECPVETASDLGAISQEKAMLTDHARTVGLMD